MRVWVIGNEGLLGQDILRELKVRGIDAVGSTHQEADITSEEGLETFYQKELPTYIINTAAYVDVDKAEGEGFDLAHLINVKGVENLAFLAKRHKVRLLHISTDYVFDGEKEGEYLETDRTNPVNVYGRTKLKGEKSLLEIYPKALSLRVASLYGKGKPGLVSGIIKALQTQEEVRHISDQVSTPTYTKDVASAVVDLLDLSGIFHYAHTGGISRLGLVLEVKRLLEEKGIKMAAKKIVGVTREESNRPAMRPKCTLLNSNKIKPYLMRNIRSWQDALRDYIEEIYA